MLVCDTELLHCALAEWPVCSRLPLYLTDPALHGRGESLGLIYTPMMADEEDDDSADVDPLDEEDDNHDGFSGL